MKSIWAQYIFRNCAVQCWWIQKIPPHLWEEWNQSNLFLAALMRPSSAGTGQSLHGVDDFENWKEEVVKHQLFSHFMLYKVSDRFRMYIIHIFYLANTNCKAMSNSSGHMSNQKQNFIVTSFRIFHLYIMHPYKWAYDSSPFLNLFFLTIWAGWYFHHL